LETLPEDGMVVDDENTGPVHRKRVREPSGGGGHPNASALARRLDQPEQAVAPAV
jgi:hypothetical protein